MKINIDNIKSVEINKFTKKQKVLLFCTLALISGIIALYFNITYNFSKQGMISKLRNAVLSKDSKTVASLIKFSDKNLVLDDKNVMPFITYLNENPKELDELILKLNKQVQANDTKSNKGNSQSFNYYITLKKSAKRLLFLNTYYFEIKPCYVNFHIPYKYSKLYVDDKYVCTADTSNYSYTCKLPYIIGSHDIRTVYETSIGKTETKERMIFNYSYDGENKIQNTDCTVTMDVMFATVYCNISNIDLYVNHNLSTEFTSKNQSFTDCSFNIGPITSNTNFKIYAQKTLPWGTFKSEELVLNSSTTGGFNLHINAVTDDLVTKFKSVIAEYNKKNIIPCLKTRNPSSLVDINASYFYQSLEKEFDALAKKNTYFTGNYLKTEINKDNITIYGNSDNDYFALIEATDYYDQDYGTSLENAAIKTSKAGACHSYTANYDKNGDTWIINSFSIH